MQAAHLAELTIVMDDVDKAAKQAVENLKRIKAKAESVSEDDYIRATQEQSRQVHAENRALKEELRQLRLAAEKSTQDKVVVDKVEYNALKHDNGAFRHELQQLKDELEAVKSTAKSGADALARAQKFAAADKAQIEKLWEDQLEVEEESHKLKADLENVRAALDDKMSLLQTVRGELQDARAQLYAKKTERTGRTLRPPPPVGQSDRAESVFMPTRGGLRDRHSRPASKEEEATPSKKVKTESADSKDGTGSGSIVRNRGEEDGDYHDSQEDEQP